MGGGGSADTSSSRHGAGALLQSPRPPRKKSALFTYTLKFLDVIVGEYVCFLQVLVRVQGLAHQRFPEGGQEVQGKRDVCSDGDPQQLAQEVQQLLLPIGDGAGGQDVLALEAKAGVRDGPQGLVEGAELSAHPSGSSRGAQAPRLTLFLLTAELGHSRRRESEELCSSLHTCHRKWRKEPPAGQKGALRCPAHRPGPHRDTSHAAPCTRASVSGKNLPEG